MTSRTAMKKILIFIAKTLLKLTADRALRKALPAIYEDLDSKIPTLLFNRAPSSTVESEIEFSIKKAINQHVTSDVISTVITLYDPIKNAKRIQRRQR